MQAQRQQQQQQQQRVTDKANRRWSEMAESWQPGAASRCTRRIGKIRRFLEGRGGVPMRISHIEERLQVQITQHPRGGRATELEMPALGEPEAAARLGLLLG